MSDELIRLQQQFAIYRSEYAILLAGAKECEARAEAAERRVAELEARLAAQAWRPVTGDDLPEDHDEALVTVTNEDGYRFVDMAEFTVGGVWWQHVDTGWRELKRVTHWRPLPAPPIDPPAPPNPSNSMGLAIGE